ncbi:hypothetical protein [Paenibacillus auburnensis]|uniref:hypothetical protein n=1 Tax=Paenibacillus auburnensis TaxID=2905649 RepID=UPI001F1A3BA1|nr:hypothetical protein [Paenibacillus auburnensis]
METNSCGSTVRDTLSSTRVLLRPRVNVLEMPLTSRAGGSFWTAVRSTGLAGPEGLAAPACVIPASIW